MTRGDIGLELARRVTTALRTALDVELAPAEALVRPSSRVGVDYQCDVAMSLAKRLGQQPRVVATAITEHAEWADLVASSEVAGPGFINLVLRDEWLAEQASRLLTDERLGVPLVEHPQRFAIDYGSPNVAKEMHVGHLRSLIIGDAILRLLRFTGHEVTPHNHLGDWGTPFGMLIEHLVDEGWTPGEARAEHTIGDLNGFYQEARTKFDVEPHFADRSRRRVVSLQGGDQDTLALWQQLVDESTRHFETVYQALGVHLASEDIYGESFYNPYLAETLDELECKGLTAISDGALCVFPPGFHNRDDDPLPLIVRKNDGGYSYATTDLATVRYWTGQRDMTDLLYVVGAPQAQHFQMIFTVSRQAGWLTDAHDAVHVNFGSMLGEDGRTIRTRAGGSIKLIDLLDEAVEHAAGVVAQRSELDSQAQNDVARAVGIGAVKYADLSTDREKDYVFTWDKMLSTEGNTSVYLQYANARIRSILRKAETTPTAGTRVRITDPHERALLIKLIQLPASVAAATEAYLPHKLCAYLYELATTFSGFYENCPILAASSDEQARESRLALAQITSDTLTLGLSLLGIGAPERL